MGIYRCIMADPPWEFRDQGSRLAPAHQGHYRVMPLAAILGLGVQVREWSARDAHLWLWAPNALVLDGTAAAVANAWGCTARQLVTWCKVDRAGRARLGGGHWCRNTTEQLLLCTCGRLAAVDRGVPTHFTAERTQHSAKPDEAYELIERLSPGPRLELFARRARQGWDSWGHEAPTATRIAWDVADVMSQARSAPP